MERTMQFEYDPERLIEEVKKRPGIWDYNHDQYRIKDMKHKLWCEIIQEMVSPDVKMSKSQLRELELQLQKKWKSMRDCYRKYTQNPKRTRRPYIYFRQLQFLPERVMGMDEIEQDVPLEVELVTMNKTNCTESDDETNTWKLKRKALKLLKTEETSDEDNGDTGFDCEDPSNGIDSDNEQVPTKVKRLTNQPIEFAFANTDLRCENDDTDRMFLLSLLPHLKAIPEGRRLEAKMSMMKVLKNA